MNMSACVKSDSASKNPDRAVLIFVSASSLNSLDWSKFSALLSGSKFPSDVPPDSSKFSPNISTFFSDENVIFWFSVLSAKKLSAKNSQRKTPITKLPDGETSQRKTLSKVLRIQWFAQNLSANSNFSWSFEFSLVTIFFKNHKNFQIFFRSKNNFFLSLY